MGIRGGGTINYTNIDSTMYLISVAISYTWYNSYSGTLFFHPITHALIGGGTGHSSMQYRSATNTSITLYNGSTEYGTTVRSTASYLIIEVE